MPGNPTLEKELPRGEATGAPTPDAAVVRDTPVRAADLATIEAGLDHLQSEATRRRRDWTRILLPLAAVAALIIAWQLYVALGFRRRDLVPGPLDVAASFGGLWAEGRAQEAVLTSLGRGLIGFAVSVVVATPLGLLLGQAKPLRRAFGPLISGLQVLPSVAWVPAAIIWFGLTDATVYFVVLMGAIPSIVNGLVAGIDQVPPQYRSVAKVLGASKGELALRVILPAALPGYLAGLKQGWAFSWRSLMAAEIIAVGGTLGFGLGSLLDQGRTLSDMGVVMSAILVILAVGIAIELAVFSPLERRLLAGRGLLAGGTR
ncbi:sulfate ABC transporter permease [Sinomonas cellulolyticus]|uniref:ABC transporter permease n=1 Tax=Sinomonas cellulolyticus TaxID=2801916 RepID=A0ABS1JYH2_9MICC|nr:MULTISPECIES: ABC transporter permease [Sinomonas]MBL0704077.1 ABC transporter permease [Sinomonas cellulolyticus]GHG56922.1 sulfate ABC transporter permease [Sinomonas sp. KCTC 49339]